MRPRNSSHILYREQKIDAVAKIIGFLSRILVASNNPPPSLTLTSTWTPTDLPLTSTGSQIGLHLASLRTPSGLTLTSTWPYTDLHLASH